MKKQHARTIITMVVCCVTLLLLSATASASPIVDSGYCGGEDSGNNLIWTLDSDGLLTISGSGKMADYTYELYAPWDDYSVKAIIIEKGVTTIGYYAFYKCSSLINISISDSVTTIGNSAFEGCSSLTNISISNSVTTIGNCAFYKCSSLTNISIPDSVTTVGNSAFEGCSSLIGIFISDSVTTIGDFAFRYCSSLTNISIPDSVTTIGKSAFEGCSSLTSVSIPDGVTTIGDSTFESCSSVKNISIPDGMTAIGNSAFEDCGSLISISIPNSVTTIGNGAFSGCSSLTSVSIPNGVTTIGNYTFFQCSSLKSIFIPNNVTIIGNYAFFQCSSLTSISIPNSVTTIRNNAFRCCNSLTSISIPNSLTTIGDDVFEDCISLTSVFIPDSVMTIGSGVFSGCSSLTSVSIPNGVTTIGHSTFFQCSSLTNISIPDSVTTIGYDAFRCCSSLTSISIPDSVTTIWSDAFYNCNTLENAYYGGTQEEWTKVKVADGNDHLLNVLRFTEEKPGQVTCPVGKYQIKVVSQNGKPLSGVLVNYDSQSGVTNRDGYVLFDRFTVDEPLITASLNGYITWSNANSNWTKSGDHQTTIILYPTTYSNLSLQAARYKSSISEVNLLTQTKKLNLKSRIVGDLSSGNFSIICSALDTSLVSEYQLWQKEIKIASCADGRFSLNVQNFVKGGDCFVRVIGKDGRVADTNINLTFAENKVQEETGVSILRDKIGITVSDDIPFLGGSSFNVGGVDLLPVEIKATEDKFYIGFNAKIWDSDDDSSGNQTKGKFDEFKKKLEIVKKTNVALEKRDGKIMNALMKMEPDFELPGGSVKVNVIGYAEANWGSTTATGEIYIVCKATTPTFGFTTWVVVVPVTVQISGCLEVNVGAKILYNWEAETFNAEIPLEVTLGLDAFVGAGVGSVVGLGVYGSADVAFRMRLFFSPLLKTIDLTGELGLKAYVGPFEYQKAFAHNTWHLYTENTVASLQTSQSTSYGIYHADLYRLQDLRYLEEESDWQDSSASLLGAAASTTLMPLQRDTYRNARPRMLSAGDGLYAVLLRADPVSGAIYTAVTKYNGSSWVEPVRLDSSEVMDSTPGLFEAEDGTLWVTCMRTTADSEMTTLLDWAQNQCVVVGTLDRDSLSFTETASFGNGGYIHNQTLATVNGTPTLVWVESEVEGDDDVLAPTSNVVCYAVWDGARWSEVKRLAAVEHPIRQIAVGETGVLCNVDEDNDPDTADDSVLMYYDLSGEAMELARGVTGNITYGRLPGETSAVFMWNGDNCLLTADGTSIPAAGITGEYSVTEDRIYYSAAGETGAYLTTVLYTGGDWSDAVTLTGGQRYLENLNVATWDGVDYLMGMDTLATITAEDVVDAKNLVWAAVMPSSDLCLDGITCEEDGLAAGDAAPVTLHIFNAGDHVVELVTVETDGIGETISCSILPGETLELERVLTCAGELEEHTFAVYETDMEDFTPDNNGKTVFTGYPDLAVELAEIKIGTYQGVEATITNGGISPASGTLLLTDESGNTILEQSFGGIEPGDAVIVNCELECPSGNYTASVVCDGQERYSYDNESTIYIEPPLKSAILGVVISGQKMEVSLCAETVGTAYCGEYDGNGTLLSVQSRPVAVGEQMVSFALQESEVAYRKVFLLDQNSAPSVRKKEFESNTTMEVSVPKDRCCAPDW